MKTLAVTIVTFYIFVVPGVVLAQTIQASEIEPLDSLNFLIGDWVSESKLPDGKMVVRTITYKWIGKRRHLRAASERIEGGVTTKMDIIYFWDPKAERIRVWVLSSDGSWSEAETEVLASSVRLKARGVTADRAPISLISTLTLPRDNSDIRIEEWTEIVVGDKSQPSPPAIIWRRKDNK